MATTDELIQHYDATTGLSVTDLGLAIPAAIDALYGARDAGLGMHDAGAAAAVAVLEAIRDNPERRT